MDMPRVGFHMQKFCAEHTGITDGHANSRFPYAEVLCHCFTGSQPGLFGAVLEINTSLQNQFGL